MIMIKKIIKLWVGLPEDLRRVIVSLTVSLSLMIGAFITLSSYLDSMQRIKDIPTAADTHVSSVPQDISPDTPPIIDRTT